MPDVVAEILNYDPETAFPKFYADVMAGRALITRASVIEAAQRRVVLRRYIRKNYPAMRLAARNMGQADLAALVRELHNVKDITK